MKKEQTLPGLSRTMVDRSEAANLQASRSVYRASPGARFAAGIAAGMVGGILMMGFMMTYASVTGAGVTMPLKALGAFVYGVESLIAGPTAMLVVALIQLGFSIVLGILFALFVSRGTSTMAALFAGIAVGIAIWVAMDLFVLRFANPTMAARIADSSVVAFAEVTCAVLVDSLNETAKEHGNASLTIRTRVARRLREALMRAPISALLRQSAKRMQP